MAERCDTFACDQPATRTVTWDKFHGRRGKTGGRFCEECSSKLWRAGDTVDPPFPLADVVPIRGSPPAV